MIINLILLQVESQILNNIETAIFALVGLTSLAILSIIGILFALSKFLGLTNMHIWLNQKIYDVLLTIVFVLLFNFFIDFYTNINNTSPSYLNNYVPQQCTSTSNLNSNYGSTTINSISTCIMHTFNSYFNDYMGLFYYAMLVIDLIPSFNIGISIMKGVGLSFSVEFPFSFIGFISPLITFLYTLAILNVMQEYMLASSFMLLLIFVGLGLLARIFLVSRTFGNTLIVMGIGIGIFYPIITILTYGPITSFIESNTLLFNTMFISLVSLFILPFISLASSLFSSILSFLSIFGISTTFLSTSVATIEIIKLINLFMAIGIGTILFPILNITIVNIFILDMSNAVGEKVNLVDALVRLI